MIALAGYNLLKYCLQRRLVLDETNAYCLVLMVSFHEEPPVIPNTRGSMSITSGYLKEQNSINITKLWYFNNMRLHKFFSRSLAG